jgi:hypothetical protein
MLSILHMRDKHQMIMTSRLVAIKDEVACSIDMIIWPTWTFHGPVHGWVGVSMDE